ncbi:MULTISPECIES: pyridoxal phosphate-dependent aminotransferase [unclassified Variovorax]|uniref:pyridoxal phosphate-dependent aminotransferase n=1 Tax=unclassified Variovorax TaxID=663243 RepID=UPI0025751947|nr:MULTISPECIES: pyridoxal phosphate-dependent aminotransferase [unclassified Variovorax]MDM0089643.1 pyridoxal phosphate-dependent aminotransferase [Variovorax sp. J22G40]MDM0148691.1 pyridoxal phosphate-dependent aminotransferase [Variovorax sp. J2P1-31]
MLRIATRLHRIQPSPSSMAGQRARELRAQGRDIVGLTAGEPDFDTPEHIKEAARRAMAEGQTRYTDVGGTPALKEAVAHKFKTENGLAYAPNEIIVGTGAKQVIFNAVLCTVEAGDEVIVPAPYWVSYPDIVRLAGGTPVFAECAAAEGFKLTPGKLEQAISPRTRWLVLNSPNNPSGAAYTREELAALGEVLVRHPHVWVLTDDIYEHLLYDGKAFATLAQVVPALKERTLTINGVSKAYAMTGWRVGFGAGPAELIKAMVKLQSQSTSGTCSISQAAALAALTGPQDFVTTSRQVFQQRRDVVVAALNDIPGIRCHRPDGAFYVFASCEALFGARTPAGQTIRNSNDWILHLLEAQNLAALQGSAYGIDTHFRISFAAGTDYLEEACRRIAAARAELSH